MSESNSENPSGPASATPVRLRHRLPKALPNVANLNAASQRVHRAETPASAEKAPVPPLAPVEVAEPPVVDVLKQRKPLISTTNSISEPPAAPLLSLQTPMAPSSPALAGGPSPAAAAVLRNHSIDHVAAVASPANVHAGLSYKQYANIHGFSAQVPMSPAPAMSNLGPCTPGPVMPASVYNAKFSNEHIMNIIKHKTLQKLKKIESEVSTPAVQHHTGKMTWKQ